MRDWSTKEIRIRGTVQGVGFRPTVWRLAKDNQLVGDVCNDGDGVLIRVAGTAREIENFLLHLPKNAPRLSQIESIDIQPLSNLISFNSFNIVHSQQSPTHTRVTADAATCDACRMECFTPGEHRFYYPFTNCTFCGPRFSLIKSVPYDRAATSMANFTMCEICSGEYNNPLDRRFHAQPIACQNCGPRIWLEYSDDLRNPVYASNQTIIEKAISALAQGKIVAIRGLGGFHLACDANNAKAVQTLRLRKRRYAKPFALMAYDVEAIKHYCDVSDAEKKLLESVEAPVVLLNANNQHPLPAEISPGTNLVGFMLPYTPLHLLLCRKFGRPLVMTSGNLADEPQITELDSARLCLINIADLLLLHDREIVNRIDDSVVRVVAGTTQFIRRARGYAPRAIVLPAGFEQAPELLAYGGELKSTFCLLKNGAAILSQHQGDLEDATTFDDYEKNLKLYQQLFDHHPSILVADKHPEYLSTKLAQFAAQHKGLPLCYVQHHHAHIASCLAENNIALQAEPVLGIALDGLGYGEDNTLWGGEFLLADYRSCHRLASFTGVAMIGGAQAIKEPWRNTYAHIVKTMGWKIFSEQFGETELYKFLSSKPLTTFDKMLKNNLAVPVASSCGRLFDAVAAALNICRDNAYFEGQGAMALEALVDEDLLHNLIADQDLENIQSVAYKFNLVDCPTTANLLRLDPSLMWQELLLDIKCNTDIAVIATRFHAGLALGLAITCQQLSRKLKATGLGFKTVALSGGCFQNKPLAEATIRLLQQQNYRCLWQSQVPANDGGLALGQVVIAAAQGLHS